MRNSFFVVAFLAISMWFTSVAFASDDFTLQPGWNTFSTPKVLSGISYSNGSGAGLAFYKIEGGAWSSVAATTTNIKPLEGFLVQNTNTGAVTVTLDYKTNLTPSEMLFQKSLSAGWNFLGISSTTSPFASIGSTPTMSVDFTRTAA